MASSSKDILSLVPSGKKAPNVAAEKIDERILRLLGIEAFEVEMDYDTYKDALREFMAKGRASKTQIPGEETERVTNEWKRVKSKKGRFVAKKKVIKAENIKSGGGVGVGAKTTIVSAQKLLPGTAASTEKKNPFQGIKDSLDNIANLFKERNKFDKKEADNEEKDAKRSRRQKLLGGLKKGAGIIAKAADKILTPVKSVFQKLIEFFIKMFLARALIKILGWFGNPQNKKKVDAVFRFLGDHWPKLLTLYLAFGTGLGRFSVWLIRKLSWGAAKLIAVSAKLIAAAGGKKWGARVTRLLTGKRGKLLKGLVTSVAVGGGLMAASGTIESFAGGGDPGPPPAQYAGGGLVRGFAGGGFLKTMFGGMGKGGGFKGGLKGAALGGALFGPLGMLLGAGLGSGGFHKLLGKGEEEEPSSSLGGFVSGEEGPDKVPAMLTAGEFVMSKGAVQKYGVAQMEAMNAAGGGTNVPKMVSGTTFAKGGGLVGDGYGGTWTDAKASGLEDEKVPRDDELKERPRQSPGAWYKNKLGQIYIWQPPMGGSQGFWMKSKEPGSGKEMKKTMKDNIKIEPKINMNLPGLGGGGGGLDSLTEQAKVYTKKNQGWFGRVRGALDMLTGNRWDFDRQDVVQNTIADRNRTGLENYARNQNEGWEDVPGTGLQRMSGGGVKSKKKPQGFIRTLADWVTGGSAGSAAEGYGGTWTDAKASGWGSEKHLPTTLKTQKPKDRWGHEELVFSRTERVKNKTRNETTGKVTKEKTKDKNQGVIRVDDLVMHKDQILEQLPPGITIQSIMDGTSGIPAKELYPILVSSDAHKASQKRRREQNRSRLEKLGLVYTDPTTGREKVKGYSTYDSSLITNGASTNIPGPPLKPSLKVTPSNIPNIRFQESSDRSGQSSGPPIINASSGSPERRRLPQKIGL